MCTALHLQTHRLNEYEILLWSLCLRDEYVHVNIKAVDHKPALKCLTNGP